MEPRRRYENQMALTRTAARQVRQELDNLKQAYPNQPPEGCKDDRLNAAYKKIVFMSAQVTTAQALFKTMVAQDAVYQDEDFLIAPTPHEQVLRNRRYDAAANCLEVIEVSFLAVLRVRDALFVPIFDEFMTILQTHPGFVAIGTGTGAPCGGLYGAGVHHMLGVKHIFNCGLHTWLKLTFGKAGAVVVGGLGGVAAGFFVVCAAVGIYMAVQYTSNQEPAHDVKQQRMMADIDRISKMELSAETMQELQELFRDVFLRPVLPIGETCPICLDPFIGDGDGDALPVTVALGCSRDHVVHLSCEREWVKSSRGDMRCVMCRQ